MEVYLQDLPPDLTDQGLKDQLSRFTKALSIQDWSCQKPRKRSFGFLTFLHHKDGERFLTKYQPGIGQSGSLLVLSGQKSRCKRSTKVPDEFLLKSMIKSAEDRAKAQQRVPQPVDAKTAFSIRSMSSGYYDYEGRKLVYAPEVEWEAEMGTVRFASRSILVEFSQQTNRQKIEISYRIIEAMIIDSRQRNFTLTLWEAPRLFGVNSPKIEDFMARLSFQQNSNIDTPQTMRLVQLVNEGMRVPRVLAPLLVYQINVVPSDFDLMLRRSHERAILTLHYQNILASPAYKRKSVFQAMKDFRDSITTYSQSIPFEVLYQLEALVRNGFLLPWTVQILLERLSSRPSEADGPKSTITARAIKKLFSQIPFPGPDIDASVFDAQEIWIYIKENEKEIQEECTDEGITKKGLSSLTIVRRVNVTPTGLTLHGPEPEAKNRILRRFPDHTDYFIRVQFCEEDGSDVRFNFKVSNDDVYAKFIDVFKNGISLCGRVYGFLGFSHSSLRSHSAWFMAPFFHDGELQTYFSVISYLGRFQDITSPARCAARIGQAFSETPLAISLKDLGITPVTIEDVTSEDGSRVFSDGVGTISQLTMEVIQAEVLDRKESSTCFQIRWAGAKGMLSLDSRLTGQAMKVRPSMIKFQSTAVDNLEICDSANKPIPMVLNRQLIKILEDLGVSDDWFFQQQNHRLHALQLITAHIANTVHFLKRQKTATSVNFPQFLRRLDTMGIDYRGDKFMNCVVEATVLRELRLLKHKARIPVAQGVTLFGIMDETGYLDEGEVYITFEKSDFLRDRALDLDNRQMIITRSPALHPGDIQLATNIIPPDHHPLQSLKNCIVFSQKGTRDLPSCLSGGDLDGDIYGVIWDRQAVQECRRTFEPADYPRAEQLNIGRQVKREDMYDFFVRFMATDQLGIIATKHMILADQKDLGTADPANTFTDCIQLAEMHSTGVDYSKTGIPVEMTMLRKMRVNKYRPDFLSPAPPTNIKDRTEIHFDDSVAVARDVGDEDEGEAPSHVYYKSDKINGKLYRAVEENKIWHDDIKMSATYSQNVWSELMRYIIAECNRKLGGLRWANAKAEAWDIRHAYEDAIANAALEYSDHATKELTELEVFTGTIFNSTGSQTRRQRDGSIKLKDEFDRIVRWTASMIKTGSHRSRTLAEDSLALSIACLEVACTTSQRSCRLGAGRHKNEWQSFKIIAACCAIKELDNALPT
ncbi:rna-dependent rna polymerase [Phaeosphaeria sp. MPI-PUGE-AT-0046c]|nr:rna-dependent rna polymerase [Phaeosphaeria sp. MPI-PUGE-AT-0046c]